MKRLAFTTIIIFLLISIVSCATMQPERHSFTGQKTYASNYDEVWDAVIELFAQKNIPIRTLEKNSGLIVSDDTKIPFQLRPGAILETPYCDCGRPGGLVVLTDIKGRFNVFVRKLGDNSTSVQVNTTYQALMQSGPYDVLGWNWECSSKGYLEGIVFNHLDSRLSR